MDDLQKLLNTGAEVGMRMQAGLYTNQFAETFSKLLEKSGVSCYRVGTFIGLDQAYLSRLRSGERYNPSPEVIMRIGLALMRLSDKITMYDVENLLNSVGRSLRIKA